MPSLGSYDKIMKRRWLTLATMSNNVRLHNVITVKDISAKIRADGEAGIPRRRPLQPAEPWVWDLALIAVKAFTDRYGSKLLCVDITVEDK